MEDKRQSLVRDERGGMYAEAVIILPVFVLVWSLIAFVNQGYRNTLRVGTETRGAGWAHAIGQCEDDVASPVEMVDRGTPVSGLGVLATAVVSGGVQVTRRQPTILTYTRMLSFTFEAYRYQQLDELDRPRPIGGAAPYGHHIDLICDEQHDQPNMTVWIGAAYLTMR